MSDNFNPDLLSSYLDRIMAPPPASIPIRTAQLHRNEGGNTFFSGEVGSPSWEAVPSNQDDVDELGQEVLAATSSL
jgi:hypothetical protein